MANLFEGARKLLGNTADVVGTALGLPEFGISERVAGGNTVFSNANTSANTGPIKPAVPYGPSQGEAIINTNNSGGAVLGAGSGGFSTGQNSALSDIESAYNANLQALTNQEGETRAQYGLSGQQLSTQYGQAKSGIQDTQKQQLGQLDSSTATVNQSSNNAVSDARNAYNELQQRNTSYLSAQGLSSSSAAEALQENLSRQTLSALNNISQNKDQTLQSIETEKVRVNDFYSKQIVNLETGLAQAQKEIELQMNSALNRISEAKTVAANQKAAARNQVVQQAQAAYQAASAQAANYRAGLDAFNATKQALLGSVEGFAQGKFSVDSVLQAFKQTNEKLRGSGVQLNSGNILAGLTNPSAAAQVGSSWYEPIQTQLVDKDKEYQAVDQYGRPI